MSFVQEVSTKLNFTPPIFPDVSSNQTLMRCIGFALNDAENFARQDMNELDERILEQNDPFMKKLSSISAFDQKFYWKTVRFEDYFFPDITQKKSFVKVIDHAFFGFFSRKILQ